MSLRSCWALASVTSVALQLKILLEWASVVYYFVHRI